MRKILQPIILCLAILLFESCGGTKSVASVAPTPKYSPHFDYSVPEEKAINSSGITIALISPEYTDKDASREVEPYSTFIENLGKDFEEMLTAKGFTIRGPFKNRDEMVYGDKAQSEIALQISISLKDDGKLNVIENKKANWGAVVDKNASSYIYSYTVGGTFYHYGTLTLTAIDPMNGEVFWKKKVDLPRKVIECNGVKTFNTARPSSREMMSDVGIYNPIAKALEEYYQDALKTAYNHIDVNEMQMIAKQIKNSRK